MISTIFVPEGCTREEFRDCWVKDELCIDRVKSSSTKKDTGHEICMRLGIPGSRSRHVLRVIR